MTIAVALCTYNGERFLNEQLAGIAAQTLQPNELIVCDDVSTDDTAVIVERFVATCPFSVRFHRNEANIGPARNFGQAIGLCNSDIIAFSDQDDVWKPNKLAVVHATFEQDAELALVFTDGDEVDEALRPLGVRLSDSGRIDEAVRRTMSSGAAFEYLLRRNVATGATMAIRSSLRDLVLPVPEGILTYHDAWIVQLAAAASKIAYVPEALMLYRRHSRQQTWDYVTGRPQKLDRTHYAAQLHQLREMRDRLERWNTGHEVTGLPGRIALVDAYIDHLEVRKNLPASPARIANILRELQTGRYHKYSSGLRSVVRDLLG